MTCQHDRDVECFRDCPKCSRYIQPKKCEYCENETDKLYTCETLNGEKSVCWDCFVDKAVNTELADILLEYIRLSDIAAIKDEYGECEEC